MRDGPLRTGISPRNAAAIGSEWQGGALVLTMERFDRVGFRLPCADRVTTPECLELRLSLADTIRQNAA